MLLGTPIMKAECATPHISSTVGSSQRCPHWLTTAPMIDDPLEAPTTCPHSSSLAGVFLFHRPLNVVQVSRHTKVTKSFVPCGLSYPRARRRYRMWSFSVCEGDESVKGGRDKSKSEGTTRGIDHLLRSSSGSGLTSITMRSATVQTWCRHDPALAHGGMGHCHDASTSTAN
jgi:hypothetical protein